MAATSHDPTAAQAARPTSRHRPLPALPSSARLPALLGHGPLHPSRLLTALRRIPLGGCAAILSELQSQDRPLLLPDWEAGNDSGSCCVPPTSGAGRMAVTPTHFRPPRPVDWGVGKQIA